MYNFIRPQLFDFHGVSMTHYVTDNWENVQNFQARPDDILISSYPKSGTTWISSILDLLFFGQTSPERNTTIPIHRRVVNLEFFITSDLSGITTLGNISTSPQLIQSHLPIQFLPKSFWEQNCKIVYVARNAKDCVVSYFHFESMCSVTPDPGDWSSYIQRFMEGKMMYGSWYDHVNGWWEKKQSYPNLHYMFYEDMIEDIGREIDKLCCFLGLSRSAEEKKRVRDAVQFEEMKKNTMTKKTTFPAFDTKKCPFIRKGKVGDWKNHFTVAQDEEFNEDYKQKMKNPALKFRGL